MKYKKSIIVLVLVIFIFGAASVCASDADDTIIVSEDTSQIELSVGSELDGDNLKTSEQNNIPLQTDNEKTVCVENDREIVGADEEGTFYDLITEIGTGGDINLTKSYYRYTGGNTIVIFNPGVINGNGAIIDMSGSTDIQVISAGTFDVTIKNLTIKNAKSGTEGSAIQLLSGAVLNCDFINNSGRNGGAVCFMENGNVTNCNFINNTADIHGGAVFFMVDGNVANCNFINNTAGLEGGAFRIDGTGNVANCNFTNNKALANMFSGGAIWIQWGDVLNCSFINNFGKDMGGAIYFGSWCGAINCAFINNTATENGGAVSGYGRAENCSFINNSAKNGGAVSIDNVVNCAFINNNATENGGAVYGYATVVNCSFINNSANKGGAAFIWDGWGLTNCVLINNSANDGIIYFYDHYGFGGLIANYNIFLNNQGSPLIFSQENRASNCDYNWFGADATDYMNNPNLPNCNVWLFLNATANPDAVSVFDTSNIIFKLYMYNFTSNNVSEYDNSCLYPVNLTVTATNGNVSKNTVKLGETTGYTPTALGDGGVTASIEDIAYTIELNIVKPSSTLTVRDIVFDYNSAGSTTVSYTNANGVTAAVVNQPNAVVKVDGTKITVSGLDVGTYTLTVTTITDTYYNPVTVNAKITVNRATPKLTAIAKTFKTTDKTKAYTVILKDNKGRAITNTQVFLKVNGITYKATTNAKGVAAFKIAKLTKQGRYAATITYNGNTGYNKATKTVQITVKSAFKTVSKGSKDKATVKKIQVALKKNGYYLKFAGHYLKVDGIFHKYTELAVKQFQKAKGLKVTGKVDEITAKKLKII